MMKKIWEGNQAGDCTFASSIRVGRKGVNTNMRIRGLSILVALLSIGAAFPSVLAGSSVVTQASNELKNYGSCSTCSSGCCTNCSEAAEFVVQYAWEHAAPFPKMKWLQPYPLIKYMSDLTLWTTVFAVELQQGFTETCYQPIFIVSEVVFAATQYALKEVLRMVHQVIFVFLPAILAVAFLKAVVYYLKEICQGSINPDEGAPMLDSLSLTASTLDNMVIDMHQDLTHSSFIFYNTLKFEG